MTVGSYLLYRHKIGIDLPSLCRQQTNIFFFKCQTAFYDKVYSKISTGC